MCVYEVIIITAEAFEYSNRYYIKNLPKIFPSTDSRPEHSPNEEESLPLIES